MKTRQLTINALLAALSAVLGFYALDMLSIKITFESIPVIMAGLMFGPVSGALVGGVGTLISQILRYGLSATTFLWMLPYIVCGAMIGIVSRLKRFDLRASWVIPTVIIAELCVTGINTFALFVDSHLYGYYTPELITSMLAVRLIICVLKAAVYAVVLMPVVTTIKRNLGLWKVDEYDRK